jgi:NAD(P)-dependent dehydrogenase (short-subunit alcohol dehydrogenase family)
MRAQRSGSIVVTTSVAALKTENFVCTPYLAAKAGAAHLARQVALELALNVRINAMAPGAFLTGTPAGEADPEVHKPFQRPIDGRDGAARRDQGLALLPRRLELRHRRVFTIDGGAALTRRCGDGVSAEAEDLYRVAGVVADRRRAGSARWRAMSDNGAGHHPDAIVPAPSAVAELAEAATFAGKSSISPTARSCALSLTASRSKAAA